MTTQIHDRRPLPKPGKPKKAPRPRVVKLEGRIAPKLSANHSQTVVRETPQAKPARRLQVVKLEGRIAPKLAANHSETLARDRA